MILVKKLKFFHLLCLSKIDREKALLTFWMEKKSLSRLLQHLFMKNRKGDKSIVFVQNLRCFHLLAELRARSAPAEHHG